MANVFGRIYLLLSSSSLGDAAIDMSLQILGFIYIFLHAGDDYT